MDVEQRARELLAAEYERDGREGMAESVRQGVNMLGLDDVAIRAIIAALTQGEMLESQLKAAVEVAEIAQRRAGRAALTPPEGFVLVEKSKLADSERLDFLDAMNVALNSHYGTNYGWRLILSPQITRLMCGQQHQGFVGDIDLNDQNGGRTGFLGCREAIDAARPEVKP